MKLLAAVVGAVLLTVSLAVAAANPFKAARDSTRVLVMGQHKGCSAVVIQPGVAMTAKHCVTAAGELPITIDGYAAHVWRSHPKNDVVLLAVEGLQCPCAPVGSVRPALDETVVSVGWLYGDMQITARGEFLGVTKDHPELGGDYGVLMGFSGPGMSGGGVFRVFLTGDIALVGIIAAAAPGGQPSLYVEVSKDALQWWKE